MGVPLGGAQQGYCSNAVTHGSEAENGGAAVSERRQVEIFSAGCGVCEETVQLVRDLVRESCDITVADMQLPAEAARAWVLGIRSVPAVAIDGRLVEGCGDGGPNAEALRAAGLGEPLG